MFEQHLSAIKDVHIFPVISLIIFMIFFLVMGVWVFRIKSDYVKEMEQLPLNGNQDYSKQGTNDYEL